MLRNNPSFSFFEFMIFATTYLHYLLFIFDFPLRLGKINEQLLLQIHEATEAAKQLENYLILVGNNLSAFDKVQESGLTLLFYDLIQQIKNIRQVISIIDSLEQKLNKELEDIQSALEKK
ncbi:MAG: hypothetical protein IPO37_16650 [Saprospiraceae bacterium]|nr:hypothetical protein [Saprospiraceae bacterium]